MTFRPAVSNSLIFSTILVSLVLLGMGILFLVLSYQYRARGSHYIILVGACVIFLMLIGSLCFRIRSYEINSGNLIVKVGFGEKTFSLTGLQSIQVEERPFAGARRDMGVGGVWSYYGRFSSARLGAFLAYATSAANGVMLVWPDKKVLVTPEDAAQFIQAARAKP